MKSTLINKIGLTPPSELFKNIAAQAVPVPKTPVVQSAQASTNFFSGILQGVPSTQVEAVSTNISKNRRAPNVDTTATFKIESVRTETVQMPDWLRASQVAHGYSAAYGSNPVQTAADVADEQRQPRVVQLFGGQVQAVVR